MAAYSKGPWTTGYGFGCVPTRTIMRAIMPACAQIYVLRQARDQAVAGKGATDCLPLFKQLSVTDIASSRVDLAQVQNVIASRIGPLPRTSVILIVPSHQFVRLTKFAESVHAGQFFLCQSKPKRMTEIVLNGNCGSFPAGAKRAGSSLARRQFGKAR